MSIRSRTTAGSFENFILPGDGRSFRRIEDEQVLMTYREEDLIVSAMFPAFPLSNRTRMIVLRDEQGNEIGILRDIHELDGKSQSVVREELEKTYFLPAITDIYDITEEHDLIICKAETDRGPRTFEVRHVRRNLRRIGKQRFIAVDVDGNRYDIPRFDKLPQRAQSQLGKYL